MKKGIIETILNTIGMDSLSDYIINWNFELRLSSERFAHVLTTEAKDSVDLCLCDWVLDRNIRHLHHKLRSYACWSAVETVN